MGSLWVALYGVIIDALGDTVGLPVVFVLMGVSFVLAALATLPINAEPRSTVGEVDGRLGRPARSSALSARRVRYHPQAL